MWIRVLYCTEDLIYANRLAAYFDRIYGEKMEMNIVSSMFALQDYLQKNTVDVVLYGDEFGEVLPVAGRRVDYAWAVMGEEVYENQSDNVIDKYQSAEQICKEILNIYAEGDKVRKFPDVRSVDEERKVFAFVSASGGVGTSAVARAFARRCAAFEKVLYLNMGVFHFNEEETDGNGLEDILVALKSRRNILPIKLVSAVTPLKDRVFTYGVSRNSIDLMELNPEDINNLLRSIGSLKEYKKLIIDMGSGISPKEIEMLKMADTIVYVTDESEIAVKKYKRFTLTLDLLEKKENTHLSNKVYIFRNKVKQNFGDTFPEFQGRVIGWAPFVMSESYEMVITRIAQSDSFHELEMKHVK